MGAMSAVAHCTLLHGGSALLLQQTTKIFALAGSFTSATMSPQSAPRPECRVGRQTEENRDVGGRCLNPLNSRSDDLTLRGPVRFFSCDSSWPNKPVRRLIAS